VTLPRIVIAGGGTGGHVFPGLAVADALRALADVEIVFVGSPRGMEKDLVPPRGYRLELLDVEPMKGGGFGRAFRGAVIAARATAVAYGLVARLAPQAIVSVGGYAAGPVSLAGVLRRVPLAVLEPNAMMGFANRLLLPFAARAYVAWEQAAKGARTAAVRLSGVPIRPGFTARPYAPRADVRRVLVMGGSLGAEAINERVPAALATIASRVPALEIVHQTGKGKDDAVRARYAALGLGRVTVAPFLDDVAGALTAADLVVARSGAGTVAEIAAVGRPALFIPFPFAADDHQAKNADALAKAGGAVWLRQSDAEIPRLAEELGALLSDRGRLEVMADSARQAGKPRAAEWIARDVLELARVGLGRNKRTNGSPTAKQESV
jgi:UDP-N-acetylglucosamine--N-acetylmuramyl-(pentapeptide) pyrophosphoryl-undecaprenol N-acetylglucosamine transferase